MTGIAKDDVSLKRAFLAEKGIFGAYGHARNATLAVAPAPGREGRSMEHQA
jgi:hypothetical protein